jgi:hypothetical protein
VVPAPGPVRVEVRPGNTTLEEIATGRALRIDGAGRRDVVGRDAVAERLQVFVQLVIAAMTTVPCPSSTVSPPRCTVTPPVDKRGGRADGRIVGSDSSARGRAPGAVDLSGSLAGNVATSSPSCFPYATPKVPSAARKAPFTSVSGTLS